MNQYGKRRSTPQSHASTFVSAFIILVFVVLGVFAVYPKISENRKTNAIENGEAEQTVEYMANSAGMSIDDYLAQYGLSTADGLSGDSTESEMEDSMTIENYLSYSGQTQTADEVIAEVNMQDKVTKDTKWSDFINTLNATPAVDVVGGEEAFNAMKEQYGLGDEVTTDTTYEEFQEILYTKQAEQAAAATEAPSDTTATDTTAADTAATDTAAADTAATDTTAADTAATDTTASE